MYYEAHFRCVDIHTETILHYILFENRWTGRTFFGRIENGIPIRRWNCDLGEMNKKKKNIFLSICYYIGWIVYEITFMLHYTSLATFSEKHFTSHACNADANYSVILIHIKLFYHPSSFTWKRCCPVGGSAYLTPRKE